MRKFVHNKTVGEDYQEPVKKKSSNRMRSSFGGHYGGMGISVDSYNDVDNGEAVIVGGGKYRDSPVRLGENDIKNRDEFEKRCAELSGEVKVYKLEDLEK